MRSYVGTPAHVVLWDAINEYVKTCGVHPDERIYGNTSRQLAVALVERKLDELLATAAKCYCGKPIACNHEAHPEPTSDDGICSYCGRLASSAACQKAHP